jgi:hypothetical protein
MINLHEKNDEGHVHSEVDSRTALNETMRLFSPDDIKQCATLLGLQVQSVVARVNFPHEETWGLYRTLGEQSKKLSSFLSGNLQNKLLVLHPQLH